MLPSPMRLDGDEEIPGITDIAREMGAIARFIEAEHCTGLTAKTVLEYPLLKDLVDQLLNYGWPLVSRNTLEKLDLPGDKAVLDTDQAVQTMERLASFFDRRAKILSQTQLDVLKEVKMANHLRYAALYTEIRIAEAMRMAIEGGEVGLPVEASQASQVAPIEEVERTLEEAYGDVGEDLYGDSGKEAYEEACEEPLLGHEKLESDADEPAASSSTAPESRPVCDTWQPALSTVPEEERSEASSSRESTSRRGAEDHGRLADTLSQVDSYKTPPELLGDRHTFTFGNDAHFAEAIGDIEQWTDSNPDYSYTTIPRQRGLDEFAHHFCNASSLNITLLSILKCEHPLDAGVVEDLTMDVLKFVRSALWAWTNGHPERRAERESLEVVRREIRARKEEFDQMDEVERGLVVPTCEGVAGPAEVVVVSRELERELERGLENESSPQGFQEIATQPDSEDDEAMSPGWLNKLDDIPEDEEPTIHEAKAQSIISVTMPIKCGSHESEQPHILEQPQVLEQCQIPEQPQVPEQSQSLEQPRIPEQPYIRDSEEFTTLLRKKTLVALGIDADSTGAPLHVSTSSTAARNVRLESQNTRLQIQNDSLRHRLAALEAELEILRPLDSPPKGSRTDEIHAHDLQNLVGQQARPRRRPPSPPT